MADSQDNNARPADNKGRTSNAPALPRPGIVILDEYALLEKVGASKTGTIFKARHADRGYLVAIKFLTPAAAAVEVLARRFQRTVRILSRIEHPNLIRALDEGQNEGALFVVMEFIEGKDLRAIMKERRQLSVADAINFATQAAAGLACLHDHGLCHRNIKPSNLLVDAHGQLKIIGMGLAHILQGRTFGDETSEDCLAPPGEVVGTYEFMSPEQAIDSNKIDARADIYSLGCTLHAFLTGHPPEAPQSQDQPGRRLPSLALARPDVPPAVDRILRKMLAARPEDRYASMNAVWADLGTAVMPAPVAAMPPVGPPRDPVFSQAPIPEIASPAFVPPTPMFASIAPPPPLQSTPVAPPLVSDNIQPPLESAADIGFENLIGPYQVSAKKKTLVAVKRKKSQPRNKSNVIPIVSCLIFALIVSICAVLIFKNRNDNAKTLSSALHDNDKSSSNRDAGDLKSKPRKSIAEEIAESRKAEQEARLQKDTEEQERKRVVAEEQNRNDAEEQKRKGAEEKKQKEEVERKQKEAATRRAVPTQAECESARKNFQIAYQGDIEAAKNPDDKIALVRKLIGNAAEPGVGPVDRYVMLEQATDFAKNANDLEVALEAVDAIAKTFEVDEWPAKLELVSTMCDGKAARTKPDPIIEAILSLQAQAMEKHLFAIADPLNDQAMKASKANKNRELRGQVQAAKSESAFCLKCQGEYDAAQKTLHSTPSDVDANLKAGKYECFILDDWQAGLPKLKLACAGADRDLVAMDLKQPEDPTQQADLGDRWCKFAKTSEQAKDNIVRASIYRRALYWYDKALEKASGLAKTRVQNAIDQLPISKTKG